MNTGDTHDNEEKKTPKYTVCGEMARTYKENADKAHEERKKLYASIGYNVASELDDKTNPAHWYYDYDPRYCSQSREVWMEEMARKHRKEAKKKNREQQKEIMRQGLRPVFASRSKSGWYFAGVKNRDGETIISNEKYKYVGRFHEALALAQDKKTGKFGFIDIEGNEVVPCKWRSASNFSEYLAAVQNDNGKCGYVNDTGRLTIPCTWEEAWPFHDGLARVQENGKIGMINCWGDIAIPCIWKAMSDVSEGLIGVMDNEGKCGFIDKTGNIVIPCQWRQVWIFKDGLAPVQDFNKRLGFIDQSGKLVIPCRWKKVNYFVNGRAKVSDSKKFLCFGDKWVYIDREGRIV